MAGGAEEKRRRVGDAAVPTFRLADGAAIPALGLGTLGGADPGPVVAKAVRDALEAGYRSFDCAECYGNEADIGPELRAFTESGRCKREDLFITSKVWNTNHAPEHVREACLNTIENLGLEYLDLYLVHWPMAWEYVGKAPFDDSVPRGADSRPRLAKVGLHQTWAAMEGLVDQGKVKRIGVSNFTTLLLGDMLAYARIPPVCNQVEMHPYLQQRTLLEFCGRNGILLAAYCPLARPRPDAEGAGLLQEPVVERIAARHGAEPAAVVLAWAIARGTVPLPKSSNAARLAQNLTACSLSLSAAERAELDSLERGLRVDAFGGENGCCFTA